MKCAPLLVTRILLALLLLCAQGDIKVLLAPAQPCGKNILLLVDTSGSMQSGDDSVGRLGKAITVLWQEIEIE